MRRFRFPVPLSIVLFLALTAAGAYYVRKGMLERTMGSALELGDDALIESLIESWPCPVNARSRDGSTLLHRMVSKGDVEGVRRALEKGADVDGGGTEPPLHFAVCAGRRDIAAVLIVHGADVNRDCYGTALDKAIALDRRDLALDLVRAGADGRARDRSDAWAIGTAVLWERTDILQALLDRGVDINEANTTRSTAFETGWRPIHVAVEGQRVSALKFLLARGADVNARDANGNTALHLAAFEAAVESVEILLAHGADVNAVNKGATPLKFALNKGVTGIADLLRAHGAKE